jgi:hypothetical protein
MRIPVPAVIEAGRPLSFHIILRQRILALAFQMNVL